MLLKASAIPTKEGRWEYLIPAEPAGTCPLRNQLRTSCAPRRVRLPFAVQRRHSRCATRGIYAKGVTLTTTADSRICFVVIPALFSAFEVTHAGSETVTGDSHALLRLGVVR